MKYKQGNLGYQVNYFILMQQSMKKTKILLLYKEVPLLGGGKAVCGYMFVCAHLCVCVQRPVCYQLSSSIALFLFETGSHMHLIWSFLIQCHWTGSHKAQGPHLSPSSILFQVRADRPGFYGDARDPNSGLHDYNSRTLATEPSPEPFSVTVS